MPALLAQAPALAGELEPPRRDALRALERAPRLAGRAGRGRRPATRGSGRRCSPPSCTWTLDADLPAERVVALARERLAELAEELRAVAADWSAPATTRCAGRWTGGAAEAPTDDTIVPLAQEALAETTEFVREHDLDVRVPTSRSRSS